MKQAACVLCVVCWCSLGMLESMTTRVNTKKASKIGGNKEEHNDNGELREKVSFSPRSRILLSPQVAPRHIGHMHFVNHEGRLLEVG